MSHMKHKVLRNLISNRIHSETHFDSNKRTSRKERRYCVILFHYFLLFWHSNNSIQQLLMSSGIFDVGESWKSSLQRPCDRIFPLRHSKWHVKTFVCRKDRKRLVGKIFRPDFLWSKGVFTLVVSWATRMIISKTLIVVM